jgi:multiple sugar transport system substrate-binding protein
MSKLKQKVTRRTFITNSVKIGAGAAVGFHVMGLAKGPSSAFGATKKGLAPGMIGGPTGFEGCERYQYGPDSAAGRAVEGLRKLVAAGKVPKKLVMMCAPGSVGHWEAAFPEGAPKVRELLEAETGIKIEIVDVVATETTTKVIQDHQTNARSYDIYTYWSAELPDIVQTGALHVLDDFMAQYKPDWLDQKLGLIGGATTLASTSQVFGKTYNVLFDGDWQSWVYRQDLFEDPKEKKAFKDQYGWDLQWPETFEQLDQLADFFHRPDQGLIGCSDIRNQYWGFTNWYQRYTSLANPYQTYFDENTGKPNIDSSQGIQAAQEHLDTLRYHHKDAISWGWPEQYASMTAGKTAITCAFPNMPKFVDNPANKAVFGKLRSGISPGRIIDGVLVRRSVWWPSIGHAVATNTKYPEAAYLILQWGTSGPVSTWMTGNPGGYYDPWRIPHLTDPLVVSSYKPYHMKTIRETIEISSPPIFIPGVLEYQTALDTNLQEVLTKRKTAAQAMKDCAKTWEKITERKGRDKQIKAIKASRAAWPTKVYKPTIKTS